MGYFRDVYIYKQIFEEYEEVFVKDKNFLQAVTVSVSIKKMAEIVKFQIDYEDCSPKFIRTTNKLILALNELANAIERHFQLALLPFSNIVAPLISGLYVGIKKGTVVQLIKKLNRIAYEDDDEIAVLMTT